MSQFFLFQWQRKLLALITAVIIWFSVNHSITATKIIQAVPIRIINLPVDKTVTGLRPNGFLTKRTTLTLTGAKELIDQLEPGDIEVVLDAANFSNHSIIQINKKNLVSLNPNLNISKHISSVNNQEFVVKMGTILKDKIPITIHAIGSAPDGYEFLDLWPTALFQTVSGPLDQVMQLKNQGIELIINLDDITKEQLDVLHAKKPNEDEVSFSVPDSLKKVIIPIISKTPILINDPEAPFLKLNFLSLQTLPVTNSLPIHVYYPIKNSEEINPETYPLADSTYIQHKNNLPILTLPVFAKNVSKVFIDIVKDSIEVDVITAPITERERLEWGIGFIDANHLEDTYVAYLLSQSKPNKSDFPSHLTKQREIYFRKRFQLYMKRFNLYLSPNYKLEIESRLEDNKVKIHIPNASLITKQTSKNAN